MSAEARSRVFPPNTRSDSGSLHSTASCLLLPPSTHRHGGRRRAGGLPAPATRVRGIQVRDHEPPHALPQLLVRRERRTARLSPSPTIVSSRVPRCPIRNRVVFVAAKISDGRRLEHFFLGEKSLTFPSRPRPRAGATAATFRRRAVTGRSTATRRLARTSGTPCAAASSPAARRLAPRTTFPAPTPRRRRRPARPRLLLIP